MQKSVNYSEIIVINSEQYIVYLHFTYINL